MPNTAVGISIIFALILPVGLVNYIQQIQYECFVDLYLMINSEVIEYEM